MELSKNFATCNLLFYTKKVKPIRLCSGRRPRILCSCS